MAYYNPYQSQYYSQLQQNYNPVQVPQPQVAPVQVPQQQTSNGLIWVQGEAGAKSYLVAPSTTVMLMDSETQRFYLKSSDASGMPLPLRVFEYVETTKTGVEQPSSVPAVDLSGFTTKAEFDAFKSEINGILQNLSKQPAKTAPKAVKADE